MILLVIGVLNKEEGLRRVARLTYLGPGLLQIGPGGQVAKHEEDEDEGGEKLRSSRKWFDYGPLHGY